MVHEATLSSESWGRFRELIRVVRVPTVGDFVDLDTVSLMTLRLSNAPATSLR